MTKGGLTRSGFPNALGGADDHRAIPDGINQTKLLEHQPQGRLERHAFQVDAHGRGQRTTGFLEAARVAEDRDAIVAAAGGGRLPDVGEHVVQRRPIGEGHRDGLFEPGQHPFGPWRRVGGRACRLVPLLVDALRRADDQHVVLHEVGQAHLTQEQRECEPQRGVIQIDPDLRCESPLDERVDVDRQARVGRLLPLEGGLLDVGQDVRQRRRRRSSWGWSVRACPGWPESGARSR